MLEDKYLPIGTVVLLKNGMKPVMITGYLIFSKGNKTEKKLYDYGGCTFPEGIIDTDHALGFNHSQIVKILHLGLTNAAQKRFNEALIDNNEMIRKKFDEEIVNH